MRMFECIRNIVTGRLARAAVNVLLLLCPLGVAHGFSTDPKEVDQAIVYRFGDYEVSHYLLDKNYNMFRETKTRESGRPPSAEETRDWFALFVARQALIGELRRENYNEKPEVDRVVRSMESYMLSSEDGPLYELLLRRRDSKAPDFQEELNNSQVLFDGVVVRLPEGESETEDFVSTMRSLPEAEQLSRMEEAIEANSIDGWNGELVWPYSPYLDARGLLATSSPGVVYGPVRPDLGVYFYYKRKQVEREVAMLSSDESQSMRLLERIERDIFIQSRRARVLRGAAAKIDEGSAISLLRSFPRDTGSLPVIDLGGLTIGSEAPLVTYKAGEGEVEVSVSEFCDYYNARMSRAIPGDLDDLVAIVYDCVMADLNRREAERLGVLDDPRFAENRRNFENGQILNYYIEHELAAQLDVSEAEIEKCYAESQERFSRPDAVEGALAIFATEEKALESLSGEVDAEATVTKFVVRADSVSNPFPLPLAVVMTLPAGQPFGPFAYEDGFAVFRKVKELSRAPLPIEKVESGIRRDLIQRKADELIKSRFASRMAEGGFEDFLNYSRYGIGSPFASSVEEDR